MRVYLHQNHRGMNVWVPATLEYVEWEDRVYVWPLEISDTTLPLISCTPEFWAKLIELRYAKRDQEEGRHREAPQLG